MEKGNARASPHALNRLAQLAQSFVRVDRIRYVPSGMAEDTTLGDLVDLCIVHECRQRVSAVVGGVGVIANAVHDLTPELAVCGIGVGESVWSADEVIAWHDKTSLYERPYQRMDGNDADTAGGLGSFDVDIPLPPIDVRFFERQHLADPHTGVDQYEHRIGPAASVPPQPVDFLPYPLGFLILSASFFLEAILHGGKT